MNLSLIYMLLVAISTCISLCAQDINIQSKIDESFTFQNQISEKPIVVIVPSYNNSLWYEINMRSVLCQNYNNYRVIYIDDSSTDNTYDLVKECIKSKNAEHKVTLIHNNIRKGALANIYAAIHSCKNHELIVLVDGDDWLHNANVLAKINATYADSNIWMTYGQWQAYPDNRVGDCKEIPMSIKVNNVYREWDWAASHLRTFYAGLFKEIKLKDLLYEGNFFDVAWDMAMLFPMLEMSGEHFKFIGELLYIYNCATPLNDFKTKFVRQIHCDKVIRSRKKYSPLSRIPLQEKNTLTASIMIWSDGHPVNLNILLETVERNMRGICDIHVLYHAQDEQQRIIYETVQKRFNDVCFKSYEAATCKNETVQVLNACSSEHILLMHDHIIIKDAVDLQYCIEKLEAIGAYAFYLSLGKNITDNISLVRSQLIPPLIMLYDDIYAWQFIYGEHDWCTQNTLSAALYRKSDIEMMFNDMQFTCMYELERTWDKFKFDFDNIGLCFEKSKAVSLSINTEQEFAALSMFGTQSKLDHILLFQTNNKCMNISDVQWQQKSG